MNLQPDLYGRVRLFNIRVSITRRSKSVLIRALSSILLYSELIPQRRMNLRMKSGLGARNGPTQTTRNFPALLLGVFGMMISKRKRMVFLMKKDFRW